MGNVLCSKQRWHTSNPDTRAKFLPRIGRRGRMPLRCARRRWMIRRVRCKGCGRVRRIKGFLFDGNRMDHLGERGQGGFNRGL